MFVGPDRRIAALYLFLTLLVLSQTPGFSRPAALAQPLPIPQDMAEGPPGASNSGSLSGRVTSDSGRPIIGAHVTIRQVSSPISTTAPNKTRTDKDGRFKIGALPNASYTVSASSPGYFASEESANLGVKVYGLGESVNIVLVKGGVITGTITSATATPLAAINVRAIKVADPHGGKVARTFSIERQSDDRGIYRIYGLEPGDYIVVAGVATERSVNYYRNQVPTYHPAGSLSTARKIQVEAGFENTGIDITLRNETAYSISGTILSSPTNSVANVSIGLFDATSGVSVYDTSLLMDKEREDFAIRGVRDGEYELLVQCSSCLPPSFSVSRIKVEGGDISNLNVNLERVGSATGRIEVETTDAGSKGCEGVDKHALGTHEIKGELDLTKAVAPSVVLPKVVDSKVNKGGEFALNNLRRGLYRLKVKPASDDLYLKSAALIKNSGSRERLRDLANDGLLVKPGDEIRDIVVTLAYGAALVKGKVITEAGHQLSGVHLYLVPAETKYADAVSLYAETTVNADGTFRFANITPGNYLVVVHAFNQTSPRDVIWDVRQRTELRRTAAASKVSVNLRPCERVSELSVPY